MQNDSRFRGMSVLVGVLSMAYLGCVSQPMGERSATAPGAATVPSDNDVTGQPATRVLTCQVDGRTDGHWAYYAVDDMTRKLVLYPSLAEYAGLTSVSSCEEAVAYVSAYDEYSRRNPNFEKQPDPKSANDLAASGKRVVLPRVKMTNGQQLTYWGFPSTDNPNKTMSPIVQIQQVFWWANGRSAAFTTPDGKYDSTEFCTPSSSCTATFLNKNWLLTAAHCMQPVTKISVMDNPRVSSKPWPYCFNASNPVDYSQPYRDGFGA